MNSMVRIFSVTPHIIQTTALDRLGGVDVSVSVTEKTSSLLAWVEEYRNRIEREQQLRDQDPELRHLYDQYQTYLSLKHSST